MISKDKPVTRENALPIRIVVATKPFDPGQPITDDNPMPVKFVTPVAE